MIEIKFTLNKKQVSAKVESNIRLIDLLRDKFNLTGTKEGCGVGECGACTVLMNGRAVNSCLVLAGQVEGVDIVTIEGISTGDVINPLQKNFLSHGAVQCGFCTPGMVLSASALLDQNPNPTDEEIKDAIAGNLCRCTGYKQIIEAVKETAKELQEK
ncbi:MAG: (2Fe-2S)-binding protein [Ignavibacteriales bacterium]|nr:(2Fe-2S)-binding protein [Ignavibacteriales bacterium]